MSSIGAPDGIGGPKGPTGPDGATPTAPAPDVDLDLDVAADPVHRATTAALEAFAAELARGGGPAHEATRALIDRLVAGVDAADRAELRELLTDLVTHDPYLDGLASRC